MAPTQARIARWAEGEEENLGEPTRKLGDPLKEKRAGKSIGRPTPKALGM